MVPAAGWASSPTDGTSVASANTSMCRGETSAVVTTSVSPAPTSISRTSSRTSSGDGRNGGIAVCGVSDGTSSYPRTRATSSARSASIATSRRHVGTSAASADPAPAATVSSSGPRATITASSAAAGSVSIPTLASRARCSSADRSVPSRRLMRGGPERHARGPGLGRCGVHAPLRDGAARPLANELCRAIGANAGHAVLLALLEPAASLRSQREPLCGPPDADRIEHGRLDDHVRRRVRHLGRRPAHDAGEADWACAIGDQEHVRCQFALDVVEGLEAVPRSRAPHDDRGTAVGPGVDGGGVERVDGLAELEHHVVRGVDDVRDRSLARGEEAHLDVVRRRRDGHAAHPAADEA